MADKFLIDKLFKNSFKGVSETPPPYTWDKIRMSLDAEIKAKRRTLLWYSAASIFVVVSFISGFMISSFTFNNEQNLSGTLVPAQTGIQPRVTNQITASTPVPVLPNGSAAKKERPRATSTPVQKFMAATKEFTGTDKPDAVDMVQKSKMLYAFVKKIKGSGISLQPAPVHGFASMAISYLQPAFEENNRPDNHSKLTLGGSVSPLYSYRSTSNFKGLNDHSNLAVANADNYSGSLVNTEYPVIGYSGGAAVMYKLSKRFSLQSGITFAMSGQQTDDVYISENKRRSAVSMTIVNSSIGPVISDENTESLMNQIVKKESTILGMESDGSLLYMSGYSLIQNFTFLEVPLVVRYNLIDKKIALDITSGILPSVLVGNKAYLKINNTKQNIGKTTGMNIFNTFTSVGLSTRYALTDKLNFIVEPQIKFALSGINSNPDYSAKPYSIGVFTGALYRF